MLKRFLALMGLIVAFASTSFASQNSNTVSINFTATVGSSITLSVPAAPVDFGTVTPGNASNLATSSVILTANWNLAPSFTALNFYAYFSTPQAMSETGGGTIPYSAFEMKGGNVGSFTAVNQPGPFSANASLLFKTVAIGGATKKVTNDNTTLDFNLNMLSLAGQAAGSYTGTLNIQAQATP